MKNHGLVVTGDFIDRVKAVNTDVNETIRNYFGLADDFRAVTLKETATGFVSETKVVNDFVKANKLDKAVLDEIVNIAQQKDVDIVFVCGDIFHDIISSSYADKLVIETLSKLADGGKRAVVAVIGNHDDGERLTASKHFAERENIFLIDSLNYEYGLPFENRFEVNLIETGKGYLKFRKGNEEMVVNLMPYPSAWFRREQYLPKEELHEKLKRLYSYGARAFEKNTINVSVGHFFTPVKFQKTDIYTEITQDMIPNSHYTALGHLHTMIGANEERNIYYSGKNCNR